jgi:hypothetical protein
MMKPPPGMSEEEEPPGVLEEEPPPTSPQSRPCARGRAAVEEEAGLSSVDGGGGDWLERHR